jgi:mannosyl-oligosaccharide alpha-1,2-mannosidase
MHMMLNGLVDKYQEMYEKAIDVAKKNLIFRVMIPNEKREILVSGTMHVSVSSDEEELTYRLAYSGSHLTCFVGGMFAMGAKLFDRKEDMDIAAKLTDGCVWAYEMTASGIMPETFNAVACEGRKECTWNETKWWDELDPNPQFRWDSYESQMKFYEGQVEERKSLSLEAKMATKTAAPAVKATAVVDELEEEEKYSGPVKGKGLKSPSDLSKRQFTPEMGRELKADIDAQKVAKAATDAKAAQAAADAKELKELREQKEATSISKTDIDSMIAKPQKEGSKTIPTTTKEDIYVEPEWRAPTTIEDDVPPPLYSPEKPLTHAEYVKAAIEEERIPPGVVSMPDRRYILR